MRTVALIPAKSLAEAKSRLAPALDPDERAAVALTMLRTVARAAVQAISIEAAAVISHDHRALVVADELGAQPLSEHGQGLNHALYLGRRWALEQVKADALLVILSDLPDLTSADLDELLMLDNRAAVVIAPSKDGGTNALLLRPPDAIPFRFGPDSAAKHAREARQRGLAVKLLRRPRLAFDVDTPDDVLDAFPASPTPAA